MREQAQALLNEKICRDAETPHCWRTGCRNTTDIAFVTGEGPLCKNHREEVDARRSSR